MKKEPLVSSNQLLDRLPAPVYQRLQPHFHLLKFDPGRVIYDARAEIESAYFPLKGTLSAVVLMHDGSMIEVATIGNEGGVGLLVPPGTLAPNKVFCQVAGSGLRIDAEILDREARTSDPLRLVLLTYLNAFLFQSSQSVACNGLHSIQERCCRWLLMTHDRIEGDTIELTHEFLATMLGVRRPSVTEVLQVLQEKNLIRTSRGKITVTDREGLEAGACECYQVVRAEYDRLLR